MAITDEAKYYGGGIFRRHFYVINFDCLIKPCSSINLFKINGDRYYSIAAMLSLFSFTFLL